jgi:pimeloyl-ACP methyl ester carboxylesterase
VRHHDLLGYGQSEQREGQDVSLGMQHGLLCALLDHWQLAAPAIVGHDFGGTTVLREYLLDRREFARITLVDPVAVGPRGSPFFVHLLQHREAFDGVPAPIHEAIVGAYVGRCARPR